MDFDDDGNVDNSNSDLEEHGLEDMMGVPCMECNKGLFEETTVTDAKNGTLHCDKCNFEVFRYMLQEDLDNVGLLDNDIHGEDMVDNYSLDTTSTNNVFDEEFLSKYYARKPVKKCTDSHPALPLTIGEQEVVIYGSSCQRPIVSDASLYISLDYNAPVYLWEQPWYTNPGNQQHIRYFIEDMDIPEVAEDFRDLIDYTIEALAEGKKVHAGCIAGHGRTGTFLAAIAQETMGAKLDAEGISAIDYVRDNYCKKAVETLSQILFLNVEFEVAIPRKEAALVKEFKEMFLEQVEVSYDDVVAAGQFMKIKPLIDSIEAAIDLKYNPPAPKGNLTRTGFATADNNQPWTPEGSKFNEPKFRKI